MTTPGNREQSSGVQWDDKFTFASEFSSPCFAYVVLPNTCLGQTQEPCRDGAGPGEGGLVGEGITVAGIWGKSYRQEAGVDGARGDCGFRHLFVCLFNYLLEWIAFLCPEEVQV